MAINLAYDVALEAALAAALAAAHYLASCFAFCDFSGYVGFGVFVVSHTDDGDPVERGISLAVAASVQSHAVCLAAGRRDRTDTTQLGQGCLGFDPLGIITNEDQHLGDGLRRDAM